MSLSPLNQTKYIAKYIRIHIACMKGISIVEYFMEQSPLLTFGSDMWFLPCKRLEPLIHRVQSIQTQYPY